MEVQIRSHDQLALERLEILIPRAALELEESESQKKAVRAWQY